MEVKSLGHVVLKVRSLERSIPFYTGVLGLKQVANYEGKMGRMAFFVIDDNHHDMALLEVGDDGPETPKDAPGLAHVALKIGDNMDQLREAKGWLDKNGVEIDMTADHLVSKSIYFHDPDGNQIEVFVDGDPKIWRDDPSQVANGLPLEL